MVRDAMDRSLKTRGQPGGPPPTPPVTDREGFEPSVPLARYTRFPGVPLKPLEHPSSRDDPGRGQSSGGEQFYHGARRCQWRRTRLGTTIRAARPCNARDALTEGGPAILDTVIPGS